MQPRGQLWFELEKICQEFKAYSGLEQRQALTTLVAVLTNMLADQKKELEKLDAPKQS